MVELLDLVPARFESWLLTTTADAIQALEDLLLEVDDFLAVDDAAALLQGTHRLRDELIAAKKRGEELRARRGRFYGDVYLYDFPPDTDLRWELGAISDGTPAILVRPLQEADSGAERALVAPDALTPWRWTEPTRVDECGEYLSPSDVLGRIPPELHDWVASRTHAALQETRRRLHRLTHSSIGGADDLAQVARLAAHAQQLAGIRGGSGRFAVASSDNVAERELIAQTESPDGRTVVLHSGTWEHIRLEHIELDNQLDDVIDTVAHPDYREPDPRAGRERYYRRGGPVAWIRVVVEFTGSLDRVVTAFPQSNAPEGWSGR